MRRWWVRLLLSLVVVALLLLGGVMLVTNTNWGRERVRRYVEGLIQRNSHGLVHIGGVTGNLLHGFTLHDVVITDSAKKPFVNVSEAWARYSLATLRGKKIDFSQVKLVRPIIVIDKQPGGKWNYDRIFPRDTTTPTGPKQTGWGTWIRFSDVTVVQGDLTVRSPWEPDPHKSAAEQKDALRKALGPDERLKLLQVPGGYQKESAFHQIDGIFPLVRLEDPAYKNREINVSALKMIAAPFRPPVADVRGLTGIFDFTSDSLWFNNARVAFPRTKATGSGKYYLANGDLHLRLHGDPIDPNDLRWAWVRLPSSGSGKLDFGLDWSGSKSVYLAQNMDVSIERAHLAGNIEATVTDTISYRNADLRFTNLETRLLTQLFPTMTFPRPLTLTGNAKFNGGEHALTVNGDVVVDDRLSGRSHLIAVGVLGMSGGVFTARDLHTRMLPLQTGLMKAIAPKLFLSGTLSGTATLNGSSAAIMTAVGDVTHVDRGAVSHATGRFAFRPRGLLWVDVDAQMHPLSLVTFGRIAAPTLGLHGDASGPLRVKGTINDLAINTQMNIAGGGFVDVRGTMDLASKVTGYDLQFSTRDLNAHAMVAKVPSTSITAAGSAVGRGFNPATMQAQLVAKVAASRIDTVNVDSANVRVAIADGIARFDTLAVGLPQGIVEAKGTFGLAASHSGTFTYHVAVDSLSSFAGLVSKDTTLVQPRPGILAGRVRKAKSDSSRVARATEVERAITGVALPRTVVDTPTAVRMNQLSGSLIADGVATGNINDFSLKGTASGSNIVARGNTVGSFTADYDWINARTPQSQVSVNAQAKSVRAAGFDLDSVGAKLTYRKPNGTLSLVIDQDNSRTYAADAAFTLDKIRNSLTLNNLKLKFDTTTWASTHTAALHWGQAGIDVENLELRNGGNGRIYVNGLVPKQGSASLDIAVDNLDIGDVIALTQSSVNASGLVSLNVHATGTLDNPQFKGAFGATDLLYNGAVLPEVHGDVSYANQTLTGKAEAMEAGKAPFLVAEGTVPINLAITGVTGPRLPADRQIALNVTADSLPLAMVPQLTDYVSGLKGKLASNFKVGGTLNHPQLTGQFSLHQGQAKVVPAGITLNGIEASIRLLGDTVVVDSLVAYNKGRIALTGGIGLKSLTAPSFDLHLQTQNAEVLKNERGNLFVSVNLAMNGPFKDAHVTGDVRVRAGVLYIPPPENKNLVGAGDPALFNVLDTTVASQRDLFPAQSPLLQNLRIDVNVDVRHDTWVRNREANVEIYTDEPLSIHELAQSFAITGIVNSDRGEYNFLSKRFQIT
ncbi:MAG TPA: translocation/assembly module TamB domain-containing protein, partial [Gemmatimonadaceae bacterium]